MSQISFANIAVTAMATTVGNNIINLEDEKERFGFDDEGFARLQRSIGLKTRYIADEGVCASDLCVQSAEDIFANTDIKKEEIEALLFVTQSPDYKAPSTAIIMQDRLGLPKSCGAFDINLGCSGFIYGLFTAFSYVNSGMKKVLLCVGDVNSYFSGERDKIFTPLMGDAGSAIIIEQKDSPRSFFSLYSDGSGYRHLIVPAGGARTPTTAETLVPKEREDGGIRRDEDLFMDGKEVFNFAIKTVPPLIAEVVELAGKANDEIDYFVLHQANPYILKTIASRLKVEKEKVPLETGQIYGNQNAASIPGTINGFLSEEFSSKKLTIAIAGFGIGLSWGGAVIQTDNIYAPKTQLYKKEI
ncbi:ketoacyl-ACP synthase III [bacterium]|nr:ketoacyl-ACP synthase III [bacterium]MBU1884217.1 ketoacyl-ACP synthase III [bacterium]